MRIFCIGKNYSEHIREIGWEETGEPVIFMKPHSSLVAPGTPVHIPAHGDELHHEVEVVIEIGKEGKNISSAEALSFISALGLGLDLTLRDVQRSQKEKRLPWELAKSFDQSAPLGTLIPYSSDIDLSSISFECEVNGKTRQRGNTKDMLFPVPIIIERLSKIWQLLPGDLIFTGTPAGVGQLRSGDKVSIQSKILGEYFWELID